MTRPIPSAEPFDACRRIAVGYLALRLERGVVSRLAILDQPPPLRRPVDPGADAVLAHVLAHLLHGEDIGALPLRLTGTPFQHRVWERLLGIPRGETRTYGEIARELGTAPRAVGGACRANPILLLVPCHRVVGRHGPGGFAGQRAGRWPRIKRWLLAAEGAVAE